MKLRAFAILVVIAALIGCLAGCEILGLGTPEQPGGGDTVCQHVDADKDEFCDECGEEYTDGSADVSPECEHENTEWAEENVKEPTCTKNGSYDEVLYCLDCDEELERDTVVTDATGHDFADGRCDTCGAPDPDYLPPHEHSYEAEITEPTCTEGGYTTYTCECGDSYVDGETDPLGHDYEVIRLDPDCVNDGAVYYECACGHSYTEPIPALGHRYDNGACTVCGEADPDYLPPHEHSYVPEVIEPTCTEDGYTTYVCDCGDSYVSDPISAYGHNYDVVRVEPGCMTSGAVYYTCACGDSYTEVIPANGHLLSTVKVNPTCTEDGSITNTCMTCGYVSYSQVLPATGHNYVDGACATCGDKNPECHHAYTYEVTDPTCTEGGYTTYTCALCGESYTGDEVPALGHSYVPEVTPPTCELEGYTTYVCRCDDSYVADEVAPTGHSFVGNNPCSTCGTPFYTTSLAFRLSDDGTHYVISKSVNYEGLKEVVIPSEYKGLPVSFIDFMAFAETDITSVIIGEGVTFIDSNAFYNCRSLEYVSIPDTVTVIESQAFSGCSALVEIELPAELTTIGIAAFEGCTALTEIVIPDKVTEIHRAAFSLCVSLTKVELGKSVTLIDEWVFYNCVELRGITLPETLETIGAEAFSGCKYVTEVYIPESVVEIFDGAFAYTGLTKLEVADGNEYYKSVNNVLYTKDGSTLIKYVGMGEDSFVIPDGVTDIAPYAFAGCTTLVNVEMPDGLLVIGDYAFNGCENITDVVIPETVTSIGVRSFAYCYAITSIVIPDSVVEMSYNVFDTCHNLSSVKIGKGLVRGVDSATFGHQTALREIVVDKDNPAYKSVNNVLYTKDGTVLINYPVALENTYFSIPDGVETISDYAFSTATSLIFIVVPDSVTYIGQNAFFGTGIRTLTLPSSVTYIGAYAFDSCYSLSAIVIPSSVTEISGSAFIRCSALTIYTQWYKEPTTWNSYWNPDARPVVLSIECLHTFEYSYKVEHTCDKDGYTVYACTQCGLSYNAYPVFASHAEKENNIDPTCTTPGSKGTICEMCGKTFITETIPAYGHNYEATITPPDCENDGYTTHTCSECGDSYITDEIKASGHSYKMSIVPPTCTENGYTLYECDCGYSYVEKRADAKGHSYNENDVCVNCGFIPSFGLLIYEAANSNGMHYATVAGIGNCSDTEILIPDQWNGLPVLEISAGAFADCTHITSISIPDSVIWVKDDAFTGCDQLITNDNGIYYVDKWAIGCDDNISSLIFRDDTVGIANNAFQYSGISEVVLPDSLRVIGPWAFAYCYNIVSIDIPCSVREIGEYAFCFSTGITEITVDDANEHFKSVDGNLYTADGYELLQYALGKQDTSFIIPEGTGKIARAAFAKCEVITEIIIPESVTVIDGDAFSYCVNLKTIFISEHLTYVAASAFLQCYSLESITVDEKNENYCSIGDNLYTKDGKTLLFYATGKKDSTFTIPSGVEVISSTAFMYCTNIEIVEIPITVIKIETYAFFCCYNLTIYCEASTQPEGWADGWNESGRPVIWTEGCNHSFTTKTVAPTCDTDGYIVYTCENCSYNYNSDTVPAFGHDYVDGWCTRCYEADPDYYPDGGECMHDWEAPTCEVNGYCRICYEPGELALGHAWVDATCTENGYCANCYMTGEPSMGHQHVPATCTEDGYCMICKEIFEPAFGHDYVDGLCSRCGESDPDYNPGGEIDCDHSYPTYWAETRPTCTTSGERNLVCTNCYYVFETEYTPVTGYHYFWQGVCKHCKLQNPNYDSGCKHTSGEWIEVTPSRCLYQGERIYICATCDEVATIAYDDPTWFHEFVDGCCYMCGYPDPDYLQANCKHVWVDPTCTKNGYCEICEAVGESAKGHRYVDGTCENCGETNPAYGNPDCEHDMTHVETVAPTCMKEGFTTNSCSKCGYLEKINLPVADHSYNESGFCEFCGESSGGDDGGDDVVPDDPDVPTDPDYCYHENRTEASCTEDSVCEDCGTILVNAYGHQYVDGYCYCGEKNPDYVCPHSYESVLRAPTCTEEGLDVFTCTMCGDSYEIIIPALDHTIETETTTPTCTEAGYTFYRCALCGLNRVEEYASAYGHQPSGEGTVTEPTCTKDGYITNTCMSCGEQYTETVPATRHFFTEYVCDVCGTVDPIAWSKVGDSYLRSGDYIYFGEHPQTIKDADVEIYLYIQDERGYYLGSDGYYYLEMTVTHSLTGYHYTNGEKVREGEVRYFKVEPIRWRILTEEDGKALILCDVAIFNEAFGAGSYVNSKARELLSNLYTTLFNELQRSLILSTELSDVATSDGNHISDHVFLLTHSDVINADYGFSSDADRQIMSSDYYRALGGCMEFIDSTNYGYAAWQLRTMYNANRSRVVWEEGYVGAISIEDYCAIIPAMWIVLN